ncbi:MAG TPA: DEAD/DEAH box helicase [Chloroflexota bacterium]|nr:DEAD/DEAH box helicase [Chloroflexota bacterium]
MNVDQVVERLKSDPAFLANVTTWRYVQPRAATHVEWPAAIDTRLVEALETRGISQPYTHQATAIKASLAGQDVTVVTSTASGKTLCYNVPVLHSILKDSASRALYLFPTKALSQDQYTELHQLINQLDADVKTYTYDGDTPVSARRAIRQAGHIVVTNPDMLHAGILPHHTKWQRLFENLKYIVVDELHYYRGVFGSHVANVLRRLARVCTFYGATPQFICCSATIANPTELAQRLTGRDTLLVDNDGSARGARHFVFYNPPAINQQLGIRRSATGESTRLAQMLLKNDVQTIVFGRSRVHTEVLLTRIRQGTRLSDDAVRGYRGGYLPLQRREIEQGLRQGTVRGVVATNALELGIDIGQLEAAVLSGYPGTIASTWQQAGRAGRRNTTSLAVFVADSSALDQFIVTHPEYFFDRQPESALVNPDNLYVLMSHLPCAAFELPFESQERYGGQDPATTQEALRSLGQAGTLLEEGGIWHWSGGDYPAEAVSLRTAERENVVIIDITEPRPLVLGECNPFAAPTLVHQDAIYLHEGQQFHIVDLNWEQKKAYAKAVNVDYYTDASLAFNVSVLEDEAQETVGPVDKNWGEVRLTFSPSIYKKIRVGTAENVGWGTIDLPQQEMQTTAYWLTVSEELAQRLGSAPMQASLLGLEHVLGNVAPLFLMCDPRDLVSVSQVKSPFTGRPTIFMCDNYPGGVGHAGKLFQVHLQVLQAARELVDGCACESGCPSCVGPQTEPELHAKRHTIALLDATLGLVFEEPARLATGR